MQLESQNGEGPLLEAMVIPIVVERAAREWVAGALPLIGSVEANEMVEIKAELPGEALADSGRFSH
ncbi:MAG: hypothetical protein M2R45_00901 [Verrucomicrobia subdivision 3 bacterium]|nr:hypothetical protein [Limisphaerales bacterium]MCS1414569.1 hypothetical protein [Limisphaerales bacterium]